MATRLTNAEIIEVFVTSGPKGVIQLYVDNGMNESSARTKMLRMRQKNLLPASEYPSPKKRKGPPPDTKNINQWLITSWKK